MTHTTTMNLDIEYVYIVVPYPSTRFFFRTVEVAFVHFSFSRDADRVKLNKTCDSGAGHTPLLRAAEMGAYYDG